MVFGVGWVPSVPFVGDAVSRCLLMLRFCGIRRSPGFVIEVFVEESIVAFLVVRVFSDSGVVIDRWIAPFDVDLGVAVVPG